MTPDSSMGSALEAEKVRVTYTGVVALDDVSITAPAAKVTAIVGPNGAGKSSLLRAIYGSLRAQGSVRIEGQEISGLSAADRARLGVGLVPQGRQLFPLMTVIENLRVMADLLKVNEDRVEEAMDRFPILRDRAKLLAGFLSGGEQQMLAVSRALMTRPKILLLDEVATGLAPLIVQDIAETLRELASDGTAIVLAAPELSLLESVTDRGYVLLRGEQIGFSEDGGRGVQETYASVMRATG